MAGELVQEDGDAVDGAAALEVGLDLLWRGAVVDVANEDATSIDIFLVLAQGLGLGVERSLHLAKLGSLGLHLLHALLHGGDFFLRTTLAFSGVEHSRSGSCAPEPGSPNAVEDKAGRDLCAREGRSNLVVVVVILDLRARLLLTSGLGVSHVGGARIAVASLVPKIFRDLIWRHC